MADHLPLGASLQYWCATQIKKVNKAEDPTYLSTNINLLDTLVLYRITPEINISEHILESVLHPDHIDRRIHIERAWV